MGCQYFRELPRADKYRAIAECRSDHRPPPLPAAPHYADVWMLALGCLCVIGLMIANKKLRR